jgi:hypothetical protein
MAVDFCGCSQAHAAGDRLEQTLRSSWFPATNQELQTCATFHVLEMFHIMTLQGKVTTYNFYGGLEKLTDNTGLGKMKVGMHSLRAGFSHSTPQDRYKPFMHIM